MQRRLVHTWLAWLVRVIWSAARRILGIPQAIDQADYCPFIAYREIWGSLNSREGYPGRFELRWAIAFPRQPFPGFRSPFRREYA